MTAPTEIKVEVIFGRAYVVQVAARIREEPDRCICGHVITRDNPPTIKLYSDGFKYVSGLPHANCLVLMSEVWIQGFT